MVSDQEAKKRDLVAAKEKAEQQEAIAQAERLKRYSDEHSPSIVEREPKTEVKPKEPTRGDELWDLFVALDDPSHAELDVILSEMVTLPVEEGMEWIEIFESCVEWRTVELDQVFLKISSTVPHTKKSGMALLYWQAAEVFSNSPSKFGHLIEGVIMGFCKLDGDSYDLDAVSNSQLYLLTTGYIDEALLLGEHFLPIVQQDSNIYDWAIQEYCTNQFEIRVGRALRSDAPTSGFNANQLAKHLISGMGDAVYQEVANSIAELITNLDPPSFEWTRSSFDFNTRDNLTEDEAMASFIDQFTTILHIVRSVEFNSNPPEKTLIALMLLRKSAFNTAKPKKKKKAATHVNLLDCLAPSGMESRIVEVCQDIFSPNAPKVQLMIYGHELLNRTALQHGLVTDEAAQKTAARLKEFGK